MSEEHRRLQLSSEEEEYVKRYDAYRPKFTGIPEGSYPNTWGNVLLIYCLLALLYIVAAGIFAFLLWLLFLNTVTLCWVFAGIGGGYVLWIIASIFYGQTIRSGLEKKYMAEALAQFGAKDADHHKNPNAI